MTHIRTFALLFGALAWSSFACDVDTGARSPVTFRLPTALALPFLDVPWPSDLLLRRDGEGAVVGIDLRAVPNPSGVLVLEDYLALFQSVKGYSASQTMYFRVEAGVDASTLPSAEGSLASGASMFLVEVDAPTVRHPIETAVYPDATGFLPAGSVAVRPVLGSVLKGRVALVVTSDARDAASARLGPSPDMRALLACDEGVVEKDDGGTVDCAPYRTLREALGLEIDDTALIQMFTVQDSTGELIRAADVVRSLPRPTIEVTAKLGAYDLYDAYTGIIEMRIFQRGVPPFAAFDGVTGSIGFDDDGTLHVERTEQVAFVLTVPRMATPVGGFPIVIYAHGTGGDLESGLGNGPRIEAHQLARAGAAMIAVSEPLHLGRTGFEAGSEEVLTFNFLNPVAGRDNWRESALEKMEIASAIPELAVPWSLTESESVTFDANRIGFLGHSQGGNVGGLFAAVDRRVSGVFLSGAGGGFGTAVVEKTEPYDISQVLRTVLSLENNEPIDRFHPVIALLQLWIDPADPISYGHVWRALDGDRPHLVATSGLLDDFTPKSTHAGLAGAFALPVVEPAAEEWPILSLLGIARGPIDTAHGNLTTSSGRTVTGAVLQYPVDGHFAIFRNAHAQDAYRQFFFTLFTHTAPEARTWMP
jgi:hypothetical protein